MGGGRKLVSPPTANRNGVNRKRSESGGKRYSTTSIKRDSNGSISNSRKEGFFHKARGSSDMKWQRAKMVVGALQIKSSPLFLPKEDMKPLYRNDDGTSKSKFEDALQAWEDLKLRKSFIKACADLPESSSCCGLVHNDSSSSIKEYVALLNEGWIKHANSKLRTRGFKIDSFLWNLENASGKSLSIMLLRFFELSTYKFRRASVEGSLDLDDMLLDREDVERAEADDSSHYSASDHEVGPGN